MRKLLITLIFTASFISLGANAYARRDKAYYGPTRMAENVWQIAAKVQPNKSVTLSQVIVALLKANPSDLVDGNINELKRGSVLRVPTLSRMRNMSASKARKLVLKLDRIWYMERLAMLKPLRPHFGKTEKTQATLSPAIQKVRQCAIPNKFKKITLADSSSISARDFHPSLVSVDKVKALKQENQALRSQVQKMKETLAANNQKPMAKMKPLPQMLAQETISHPSIRPMDRSTIKRHTVSLYILVIVLLSIVVVWMPWPFQSKTVEPEEEYHFETYEEDEDTEDEYDFMNSEEGIAARLDLARAYIAMEDFAGAHELLNAILTTGDKDQQRSAEALLAEIK